MGNENENEKWHVKKHVLVSILEQKLKKLGVLLEGHVNKE